jgi:SAM-dependent methyltransferase
MQGCMGIDVHSLNFIKLAHKKKHLGRVVTIGRQSLLIPKHILGRILDLPRGQEYGEYCERLLREHFGAVSVDSIDNSDFENATHIMDMNKPIDIRDCYDTVIDGGSLEHIYNVPQALRNFSQICKAGGQILHLLPANNFCGHGFYQFSPELFFSLYSEKNGYQETQIFMTDQSNENYWYEVKRPMNGERVYVVSNKEVAILVRTVRMTSFSHDDVQQSDYVHRWKNQGLPLGLEKKFLLKEKIKSLLVNTPLLPIARFVYQRIVRHGQGLSNRNPYLTKHSVSELLANA